MKKISFCLALLAFSVMQVCGKGKYRQEQFANQLNIEVGYQGMPEGYQHLGA